MSNIYLIKQGFVQKLACVIFLLVNLSATANSHSLCLDTAPLQVNNDEAKQKALFIPSGNFMVEILQHPEFITSTENEKRQLVRKQVRKVLKKRVTDWTDIKDYLPVDHTMTWKPIKAENATLDEWGKRTLKALVNFMVKNPSNYNKIGRLTYQFAFASNAIVSNNVGLEDFPVDYLTQLLQVSRKILLLRFNKTFTNGSLATQKTMMLNEMKKLPASYFHQGIDEEDFFTFKPNLIEMPINNDNAFHGPLKEVIEATLNGRAAIPSYRLGQLISEYIDMNGALVQLN